jgi:tRNA threonylcarbamoyladenosine biosynthesis protein TsaB
MSLLLNIDTATETASVSIARDGHILQEAINKEQKDHAVFLQVAIQLICKNAGITLHKLDAVAVTEGPGSYTGLRVGMASAKGLCFALQIPLITVGTLNVLAWQAINQVKNMQHHLPVLFCPMIDARRMEVFTAIFDSNLNPILVPSAMIIEQNSFANLLLKNKIVFSGNGSTKWQLICKDENAFFVKNEVNTLYMSELSHKKFLNRQFEDVAYAEPLYIKEFFNPTV